MRLATAVDDITAGTALPAQHLADMARTHDLSAVQAQSDRLHSLADTLVDVARSALVG